MLVRPEQGKLELLNVKEEITVQFFLAGLEISVYSFNHTDVSIFGRTRKHINAWAAFML